MFVSDCQVHAFIEKQTAVINSPKMLIHSLCVDANVIVRVYSLTLFGAVIQSILKVNDCTCW